MKKPLILIGGGGHCRSCIDVIEMDERYAIVGVLDAPHMVGKEVLGYKIIGSDDEISVLAEKDNAFFVTLGQIKSSKRRIDIYKELKQLNVDIPTFISPFAHVSRHASLGEGTVVHHNAVVNAAADVGNMCIINTAAVIEHDVKIGDYCHISTSAMVNGGVTVGNNIFVGSNATVKDNVKIGDNSLISFHSRVVKDLESGAKVLR